jgi:hypothetical protein
MGKYITEETMRRIQISNSLSGRLYRRRLWIDLACSLAICYHYYNATRIAGAASDSDLSLEETEKNMSFVNQFFGLNISLSDMYETRKISADASILYYKVYKHTMKTLENEIFMPAIAEQLFKELYDEYIEIPFIGIIHKYYSEVAFLLLKYMCEKIDYDTFMDKLLSTKVVSNQEPMNREILKEMIATGDKWITRYTQIIKAHKSLSAEK